MNDANPSRGGLVAPALARLREFRQFIVYRIEVSKARPGKLDKLPVSTSGHVVDAHDTANWMTADSACRFAEQFGEGYGVGFVLTADCKLFCLDIDNCLSPDRSGWTPKALELCGMFPGAAIEVSVSGSGLHIWGTYTGDTPPHACKDTAHGLELYTERRFVALGNPASAMGDAATDCTLPLQALINTHFKPGPDRENDAGWSDGPCEEWRGPEDDDELIRRALHSNSAAAAFGNRASFADLWNCNVEALARAYPDAARAYDASSADAALAQHLAFWTGKDCERIARLMKRSNLVRDKWDRSDYLSRTIMGAVGQQEEVFVDQAARRLQQVQEAMRIGEGSDQIRLAGSTSLDEMLERFVFVQDGQQVVDLQQPQHVAMLSDWKATHKASTTTLEVKGQFNFDGTPKTKVYDTASLWEKSPKRQQAQAVTFMAGGKRLVRDPRGREAVNTWTQPDRSTPPGDASLFLAHVAYLFGDEAPRFLDWLAHIEQCPGELPQSGWLHISDRQGTGRNWIAGVIARLWPGYAAVNFNLAAFLNNGFNDRLSSRIIAVVDEINEGDNKAKWGNAEVMKSLVNEGQRTINPKFGRIREEHNACRWLIFSNHRSALALSDGDRRFNVVIREGAPKDTEYYRQLYSALKDPGFIAGVAHLLGSRDLTGFNPGAHAIMNAAKEAVIAANRSEVDDILLEVVNHWPCDVIQTSMLGELITGQIGGKVTNAHRHALERRGITNHSQRIRLGTSTANVSILRNVSRWKEADPSAIRAELERGPQAAQMGFGGARTYLDNLTAA